MTHQIVSPLDSVPNQALLNCIHWNHRQALNAERLLEGLRLRARREPENHDSLEQKYNDVARDADRYWANHDSIVEYLRRFA